MALSPSEILAHPRLEASIAAQSRSLFGVYSAQRRAASTLATRQRWYMVHAVAAAYFQSAPDEAGRGLLVQRLVNLVVVHHGIASRNTAAAFFRECLRYGMMEYAPVSGGLRYRPVKLSSAALQGVFSWVLVHFATLDALDGGTRAARLRAGPEQMAAVHPAIAAGLLSSSGVRHPGPIYDLFAWIKDGGLIMDRLILGMEPGDPDRMKIPVDVRSSATLAEGLLLSRTHMVRTLATAERRGCLGWSGAKGKSQLWISAQFRREYYEAQAEKLAIIDAACEAVMAAETPEVKAVSV